MFLARARASRRPRRARISRPAIYRNLLFKNDFSDPSATLLPPAKRPPTARLVFSEPTKRHPLPELNATRSGADRLREVASNGIRFRVIRATKRLSASRVQMIAAHVSSTRARHGSDSPNPTRRGGSRRKRLKSYLNLCLLKVRSDSRTIRFTPQIASSDETKEIAFNGRYRQERLYVPSSRDVRVRSAVSRPRFEGGRSGCRQK